MKGKVILITGAAHRIGAQICRTLHANEANIILHYRHSQAAAEQLAGELNGKRHNSVSLIQADLNIYASYQQLIDQTVAVFGRLDALINNASEFYPTPIGDIGPETWDNLMTTNLKAPFFLSQAAAPHLKQSKGCIVNIVDIHSERPMKNYPVYCISKAALAMQTKALARELGPDIRVNAVSPGAVMWPKELNENTKQKILGRTALKRPGNASDIASAVLFIIKDAHYMTGEIIAIDGGRSLHI